MYLLRGRVDVTTLAIKMQNGYISDSGTHYILWFQKGGIAEHLTKDL
jgi:hypothetical protein